VVTYDPIIDMALHTKKAKDVDNIYEICLFVKSVGKLVSGKLPQGGLRSEIGEW
jgi:hypothetical protein